MSIETYFDEENKLWYAKDSIVVLNPNISMGHAILWTLASNPGKVVQITHETKIHLTAGEMRQQIIRAAANLQKLGYEKGDVFGVIARNSHYLAPIIYASFCLACPFNTLDASFTKPEIMHMFSITKPKVVFCDVEVYDVVRESLNELENDATIYTFGGSTDDSTPVDTLFEETPEAEEFSVVKVDAENTTAAIVCTSGSTGLPKGVRLSHSTLLSQCSNFRGHPDDVIFTYSTVYWISGLINLIICGINCGCRVITTESFTPDSLIDMIEEYRVTLFSSASYYQVLLLKSERIHEADLSSLHFVLCTGSKLSIDTALGIAKLLPNGFISHSYGMTELGGLASSIIVKTEEDTSVGQLWPGTQAKIVDDDGNRLGQNEVGEICLKTPKLKFLGYYDNEEATADAIDDDGFLKSGDIGYFDSDGNLHLVDRKKDMIKYCSSQESPTEIEQFLIKFPSIKAVCVVGIPDPVAGDLPAAVIILNEVGEPISKEEVEQLVADEFADYKQLRGGVYFVESLPLTGSGKVVRRYVRDMAIELYEAES